MAKGKSEKVEHTIKLKYGYTDPKTGLKHKSVTFGKRLTGNDLMLLDSDPRAQNATQYVDMIRLKAITAFGKLKMPVSVNILLGLNKIDRGIIADGFEKFCELTREDLSASYPGPTSVVLYFGFDLDGTLYPKIELQTLTTGLDEVEADGLGLSGLSRACFLIGRSISSISTADGAASIDGPVDLDKFKDLDGDDINLLRIGAEIAEAFFRLKGEDVPGEDGAGGVPDDEADGDERGADPKAPDAAAE